MSNSDETLEQPTIENEPTLREVLDAVTQLTKRFETLEKKNHTQFEEIKQNFVSIDIQFESIRTGIVHNNVAFDRLQATVFSIRANLTELTEEIKNSRKVLV